MVLDYKQGIQNFLGGKKSACSTTYCKYNVTDSLSHQTIENHLSQVEFM